MFDSTTHKHKMPSSHVNTHSCYLHLYIYTNHFLLYTYWFDVGDRLWAWKKTPLLKTRREGEGGYMYIYMYTQLLYLKGEDEEQSMN
jgi:hypothetical protein